MKAHPRTPSAATAPVVAAVLAALLAAVALVVLPAPRAQAADLSRFDAGYLISDQNFYDAGSMDVAQVQAFLTARGSSCRTAADGTPCLKDARFDTTDRVGDNRCPGGYRGGGGQSAAQVVVGVARGCGINPRVLLVMLQKEQSLVTRTTATPTSYRSAMGFACPDTAPCDAQYYGFFNQVFQAAWQLKSYVVAPRPWHFDAGAPNTVLYHPDAACGSSQVFIRNQATASLYNYTPYQPNAAALAAGYGRGDGCSSYGNRNFFAYYYDWFGAPNGSPPIGSVDAVLATNTTITVHGWTLDPDTSDPVQAHVYVDGAGGAVLADAPRADVAAAFGRGDRHGFAYTTSATPGPHRVCTFAIASDPGPNTLVDCRVVVVPDRQPIGVVDSMTATEAAITVTGWSLDPDTAEPNEVHVYVDGVGTAVRAEQPRPDIAAAYRTGDRHGFATTIPAARGSHQVCVFGISTVPAPNTLLSCRTVVVEPSRAAPFGAVDTVATSGPQLTVSGWTIDPDTTASTEVHLYVDGQGTRLRADGARPDLAVFGRGDRHGFSYATTLAAGSHQVCLFAINTGPGDNTLLTCRQVVVADAAPVGSVDSVTTSGGRLTVSGWTLDPDTVDPIAAHVYVDGVGTAVVADLSRPDVAAALGRGDRHGFAFTTQVGAGPHQVCVFGIGSTPAGSNSLLGCRTVG